jgi:predicted amidophosphoribosyltransferase
VSIPVADELTRIRPTARQVDLNGDERRTNVAGAFSGGSALANKVVILVDDVQTTGSTLNECARACMSAGAVHVSALTLAIDL